MERPLLLHMNGGEGERSYANNSSVQVLSISSQSLSVLLFTTCILRYRKEF